MGTSEILITRVVGNMQVIIIIVITHIEISLIKSCCDITYIFYFIIENVGELFWIIYTCLHCNSV